MHTFVKKYQGILAICLMFALAYAAVFINMQLFYTSYGTHFPQVISDGAEYVQLARNLLEHGIYSYSESAPYHPQTFRVPGYPAFIALVLYVSGSVDAVVWMQILLTVFSALLVFLLAEKISGSRAPAYIAAVLFCINPNQLLYTLNLNSEPLFVFLLLLTLYMFLFSEERVAVRYGGAGLLLGAATLVRALGTYLPVFFVAYLLLAIHPLKKALLAGGILLAAFAFVLAPWVIRNHSVSGVWGVSATSANSFYEFYVPQFLAREMNLPIDTFKPVYLAHDGLNPESRRDLANAPELKRRSFAVIAGQPVQYMQYHFSRLRTHFLASSIKDTWSFMFVPIFRAHHDKIWFYRQEIVIDKFIYGEVMTINVIICLALVSLFFVRKKSTYLLLWSLIMWFYVAAGPVATYARFRVPGEPLVFILGAISAVWLGRELLSVLTNPRRSLARLRAYIAETARFVEGLLPRVGR